MSTFSDTQYTVPTLSIPLYLFKFSKFLNKFFIAQSFQLSEKWLDVNEDLSFKDFSRHTYLGNHVLNQIQGLFKMTAKIQGLFKNHGNRKTINS